NGGLGHTSDTHHPTLATARLPPDMEDSPLSVIVLHAGTPAGRTSPLIGLVWSRPVRDRIVRHPIVFRQHGHDWRIDSILRLRRQSISSPPRSTCPIGPGDILLR